MLGSLLLQCANSKFFVAFAPRNDNNPSYFTTRFTILPGT